MDWARGSLTSCLREPVFKFLSIRPNADMVQQRGFFLSSAGFGAHSNIQDQMHGLRRIGVNLRTFLSEIVAFCVVCITRTCGPAGLPDKPLRLDRPRLTLMRLAPLDARTEYQGGFTSSVTRGGVAGLQHGRPLLRNMPQVPRQLGPAKAGELGRNVRM